MDSPRTAAGCGRYPRFVLLNKLFFDKAFLLSFEAGTSLSRHDLKDSSCSILKHGQQPCNERPKGPECLGGSRGVPPRKCLEYYYYIFGFQ